MPRTQPARRRRFQRARSYWHEYILESYVNHRPDMIFLKGLPDVEESRPHSRANSDRW